MSFRKKLSYNKKLLDEESISDHDYLTSVLKVLNGYCKVNFVVPQTNLFYTSDSLLPINAKVKDTTLNNKVNNNQKSNNPDSFSHILKNVADLKIDENSDDKELQSSDKASIDEFKIYSKPFYSDNSNDSGKREEKKRSMSPKGKRKKNKLRVDTMVSTSENQTSSSSNMHIDQNSTDYFNEYEKENNLQSNQEQDLKKKQMKNAKNVMNNIHVSRSSNRNPENKTQNSPTHSQCPLCFLLYPTPDIEAHASECKL